jgi:hypothetical protein
MITCQNGYAFSKEIDFEHISEILMESAREIITYFKNKNIKIHLVSFKDFYEHCSVELKKYSLSDTYEFNTQPNMIFYLDKKWKSKEDYVGSFSKKYRDQYKRAHKKFDGILVKELTFDEVVLYEETIYDLYHYVAKNAPFNTFFLAKNHFSTMKKQCQNHFLIFGYFLQDKLVGFHTILSNGSVLETYFLGYDAKIQKENMLYLNMLYNMTAYGIENGYKSEELAKELLNGDDVTFYPSGSKMDRYEGVDVTIDGINYQIKPLISYAGKKEGPYFIKTYGMRDYQNKKLVDYIAYANNNETLIFENSNYIVDSKFQVTHKNSPKLEGNKHENY